MKLIELLVVISYGRQVKLQETQCIQQCCQQLECSNSASFGISNKNLTNLQITLHFSMDMVNKLLNETNIH